ncbi:hypothetical protein, partial [Enterococcus durans]|uniref:hypothetical protein n=1 Tax=Enterococcus durans TaxID=53345 RepID=UPI0039A493A3
HLESSYEFVSQINSKGFQGVFSIFFYTKKMLANFTNIKKYRAFLLLTHPCLFEKIKLCNFLEKIVVKMEKFRHKSLRYTNI